MRAQLLGETVTIHVELVGRVVGRTFQERPTYDIATPDGAVWHGIPADWIGEAADGGRTRRGAASLP